MAIAFNTILINKICDLYSHRKFRIKRSKVINDVVRFGLKSALKVVF